MAGLCLFFVLTIATVAGACVIAVITTVVANHL